VQIARERHQFDREATFSRLSLHLHPQRLLLDVSVLSECKQRRVASFVNFSSSFKTKDPTRKAPSSAHAQASAAAGGSDLYLDLCWLRHLTELTGTNDQNEVERWICRTTPVGFLVGADNLKPSKQSSCASSSPKKPKSIFVLRVGKHLWGCFVCPSRTKR
jgi:hypothetical protein